MDLRQKRFGKGVCRVGKRRHAARAGKHLPDQFETFSRKLGRRRRQPCDVSTWPGQATYEPRSHRIAGWGHDDRDFRCRTLCRLYGGSFRGDDNIDLEINELRSQRCQTIQLSFRRAILDLHILTVDVAELSEPLPKYPRERFTLFDQQHAKLCWPCLLRAHYKRPRSRRAHEHYNEIAPSHAITYRRRLIEPFPQQSFRSEMFSA